MARTRARAAEPTYTDDVRAAVRQAESAGQGSACSIPAGDLPAELVEALDLRVKVNLATTGGRPVQSCGGTDPDVQRLEAPYRKPRTAAPADPAPDQEPAEGDLIDTPDPDISPDAPKE